MSPFIDQITVPIIASIITSALVSLGGFLIGVRAGKERTDRTALRAVYKDLYSHFHEIVEAAAAGQLKQWQDYKTNRSGHYLPLMKSMQHDGSIHLLPRRIADRLVELETNFLIAAFKFNEALREWAIPAVVEQFRRDIEAPEKSIHHRTYVLVSLIKLILEGGSYRRAIGERLSNDPELGIAVETPLERGQTQMLYAYSDKAKSEISVAAFRIRLADLTAAMSAINAPAKQVRKVLADIHRSRGTISARISDPHPLWETVVRIGLDAVGR